MRNANISFIIVRVLCWAIGMLASLQAWPHFLKPDGDADPFAAMLLPGVLEFFARYGRGSVDLLLLLLFL